MRRRSLHWVVLIISRSQLSLSMLSESVACAPASVLVLREGTADISGASLPPSVGPASYAKDPLEMLNKSDLGLVQLSS